VNEDGKVSGKGFGFVGSEVRELNIDGWAVDD
jgi:hypothetical protein